MVSHPFLGEGEPRGGGVPVCNRHQGEGDPLQTQGMWAHQSVTDTKERGEGEEVSHIFLGEGEPKGVGRTSL